MIVIGVRVMVPDFETRRLLCVTVFPEGAMNRALAFAFLGRSVIVIKVGIPFSTCTSICDFEVGLIFTKGRSLILDLLMPPKVRNVILEFGFAVVSGISVLARIGTRTFEPFRSGALGEVIGLPILAALALSSTVAAGVGDALSVADLLGFALADGDFEGIGVAVGLVGATVDFDGVGEVEALGIGLVVVGLSGWAKLGADDGVGAI